MSINTIDNKRANPATYAAGGGIGAAEKARLDKLNDTSRSNELSVHRHEPQR